VHSIAGKTAEEDMAREYAEQIFSRTMELAERFIRAMSTYPAGADDETWAYQATVHFFFCKAYKTYQALALLCRAGFVEDGEVLSRTIFELYLQTRYMSTDPKRMARLFAEHAPVRRLLEALDVTHEIRNSGFHLRFRSTFGNTMQLEIFAPQRRSKKALMHRCLFTAVDHIVDLLKRESAPFF
jgi:hypothetical protein